MANIFIGVLSAIVDNIPVMFAVLSMNPDMALGQWLLVTLTAGVGGSLLSIGSAAGVALMGQAHGMYTFFGHLKWLPAILLGYLVSIGGAPLAQQCPVLNTRHQYEKRLPLTGASFVFLTGGDRGDQSPRLPASSQ